MREEFSVEHRANKPIAYMAMKQLHPRRMSTLSHGYDFGKISSVTGNGQEVHSESECLGIDQRRGQGSAHSVPCRSLLPHGDLTGLGRQQERTRSQVGGVQ